jgi:hypothetical protein
MQQLKISPFIIILTCCISMCSNTVAQQNKTYYDKNYILIGEPITATILSQKNNSTDSVIFKLPDTIPHFEIILKSQTDTSLPQNLILNKTEIIFTSFDSGSFTFPSLTYTLNNIEYRTDSAIINVGYMPIDSGGKARDVKPIIEVKYFNWFWIKIAIAVLLFAIASFFFFKYFIKKKKTSVTFNKNNAYDEALKAIKKLHVANTENSISSNEIHVILGNIFKTYFSNIQNTNIFASTSDEVLQKLNNLKVTANTVLQAKQALQTSDATKFAKYNPVFNENKTAIDYIENTITELESINRNKA